MDAFLEETDDEGRMVSYGHVASVAVVEDEDGFTIPANTVAYWVGEAMGSKNYVDLDGVPEVFSSAVDILVRNTIHLAGLLSKDQYLGEKQ